jgi:hypothetical protein
VCIIILALLTALYSVTFQLILAGWLNGVGSFLRNVSTFDIVPDDTRYTWCLAGKFNLTNHH